MNGRKKKVVPGCMGSMINIFDMSVAPTKMLTEKAHSDAVSPIHRKQPVVVKNTIDPTERRSETKPSTPAQWEKSSSRKKSDRISMKMLLAQEMSKDMESKQKPPNIVARLMGLDALPLTTQRSSEILHDCQQLEDGYMDNLMPTDVHLHDYQDCRDAHETWQEPVTTMINNQTPMWESSNEQKMAFVHDKFTEAKLVPTDENLFHSQGFQDALKVLSSNKDLFLKYLEEPNSLLSKHLNEVHTSSSPSQTECITVLKPSKTVEAKKRRCETQKRLGSSNLAHKKIERLSQPTSIVVLKPQNITAPVSLNTSFKLPGGMDYHIGLETDDTEGSREVAREVMQQMRERLGSGRGNEASSPVFENRYAEDESLFSRSDNEYLEGADADSSYMEIVTPTTSQYSWDHSNRFDSPYSPSSYGSTSHSQESSVIREAKRRLSERLALVASNGTSPRQKQVWGSSSTLGDMLAVPEIKRAEDGSCRKINRWAQSACVSIDSTEDGSRARKSSANLSRSKSLPLSSSPCENGCFDVKVSNNLMCKPSLPDEVTSSRNMKSSLKGKVSSLFFSRNKKPGGEKPFPEESPLISSFQQPKSTLVPSSNDGQLARCTLTAKADFRLSETQDQPSPSSVLDAPFKDDANRTTFQSCDFDEVGHLQSQSLSRSAPIGSIARSLSWDENRSDLSFVNRLNNSSHDTAEAWFELIHKLLSFAGFVNETLSTFFTRWHSPTSPLNPIVMHEFLVWTEEGTEPRDRLLVCDCINEALIDIGQNTVLNACPWSGTLCSCWQGSEPVSEQLWGLVREWCSGDWKCMWLGSTTEMVDRVVKREVTGRKWAELMWWERDEFCKEVGGELLEELVGEALADLMAGCLH